MSIDEEVLKRAEARAREEGTSLDAVLVKYVASFAGDEPQSRAVAAILELAKRSKSSSAPQGHTWTRDELHER